MVELFSAYARPRLAVGPLLLRAAPLLPALLVCLYLKRDTPSNYASFVVLTGVAVWAISMLVVFLRPCRAALSVAIFGAMLVGTGMIITTNFIASPGCVMYSNPVVRVLHDSNGEPQALRLSIVCY